MVRVKLTHFSTFLNHRKDRTALRKKCIRVVTSPLSQHLKAIIIHVHVPLHCTAWINRESWSLVETHKPVASHFSRSTLCFGGFSLAVIATKKKVNTGRQFLADSGEQKLGAPRVFFSFFFLSSVLFKSYLFGSFLGLFSEVERDPEEAEFSALGWSPPSLSLSV